MLLAWQVGLVVAGAVVVWLAATVPAFLALSARRDGAQYFSGGVPAAWQPVRLSAVPPGLAFEAGWRVPGPGFGSDFPEVILFRYRTEIGSSTLGWLADTAALASERGWASRQVLLADGAPALTVSLPRGGTGPGVPAAEHVGVYLMYATRRDGYYYVIFQTDSSNFAAEEPAVQKVFSNFRGYEYTGA